MDDSSLIKVRLRSYDVVTAALPEDVRLDDIIGKPIDLELDSGSNISAIFEKLPWLGNPYEDTVLVFINGQAEMLSSELRSDDIVDIITPSGGG